jgi:hypothetical protein
VFAAVALAACGKKGPPLAPLRLLPAPVSDVAARRTGDEVTIRFSIPTKNQNGPGPVDLDRVEIYAVTVAPEAPVPPNQLLMTKERLVGTVSVKPPPPEGEQPPSQTEDDKRPAPGERAVFVEELTPEKLVPVKTPAPSAAALPVVVPMPSPVADHAVRVYAIRGISKGGRAGPPASRISIPLVALPPVPAAVAVQPAEHVYRLDWVPPVLETGGTAVTFNVYLRGAEGAPLNPSPLTEPVFEHGPVQPGREQCFVVSSVLLVQNVPIESAPSPPACTAWVDVYAPSAPRGLQAVAADDGISLSWDANAEPDVAGYVVLRGETPGDTLQPLTREPLRETNYRDTTAQSGVRYVYAIVALDKAAPPNTSTPSDRQEVTAR